MSSELLYCRGIAPELIFEFKHALIKDAAYQGLLRSKRLDRQCDCDLAWSHLTRGKVLAARGNASQANAAYTLAVDMFKNLGIERGLHLASSAQAGPASLEDG